MLKFTDLRASEESLDAVLQRPQLDRAEPVEEVRAIIERVRSSGDKALFELTRELDGVELESLRVPKEEISASVERIDPSLREALEEMAEVVSSYHEASVLPPHRYEEGGVSVELLWRPVKRAGVYAPGGRAIYPSTVLMCALPARVAGVEEIVLCAPPQKDGSLPDVVLAAAAIAGIEEAYSVGGAQAIAAMAYGTQAIPKVDVIVGPGNKYVSLAKRMVAGHVGVPNAFAGPSEVVVIADSSVDPSWAAIDLIVQAEHGPDGLAWLICWEDSVASRVEEEIGRLLNDQPRRTEIEKTLSAGGNIVLVRDETHAVEVANWVAPEHLELLCEDPWSLVPLVENAGAVYCGPYSTAAFGDYMAGPSHVLPTFRSAKFASGLSSFDFIRFSHAIEITEDAIKRRAAFQRVLAQSEGLFAHAQAVDMRAEQKSNL